MVVSPGTDVDPETDLVDVDGRRAEIPPAHAYIILNKPPGFVVTMNDPQGRRTIADLTVDVARRVFPVGRLDAPTEGLIILTDDGELAHRIMHPSFELEKVYRVTASGILSEEEKHALELGIELDGRRTAPAKISIVSTAGNTTTARIAIHEGRKRQVRKMFEAVGHPVSKLRRVRVGPVELGDLTLGKWRRLRPEEVAAIRRAVGLKTV